LVVAGGVQDQVADDLGGVGVDDGDVQVVDEDAHGGVVVFVAQADVVQASAVAQGDAPGLRAGGIDLRGGSVAQRSVWPLATLSPENPPTPGTSPRRAEDAENGLLASVPAL
jgi:hypothetical protein